MEKVTVKSRDMKNLYKYREHLCKKPSLRCLFLELTDKCNLKCLHCGSRCDGGNRHFLDTDLIQKSLIDISRDFSKNHYMICLTGGEPLLHPDFDSIVERINALNIPWGMTTNGTLIDKKMAEKLKLLNMASISISLDGLEESHEWLRQTRGCFGITVNAIRFLKEAGHSVQVTTAIHKKNICELDELYDLMRQLQVDSWRVINIEPIGRALNSDDLLLSHEQIIQLLNYIREKRFQNDNPLDVCYGCSHYLSFEYEREVRDFYFQCGAGTLVASIFWNGDIGACLDIERRPELVQGNIGRDRLFDVWTHRFQVFRRDRTLLCDTCLNCNEREFCGGDSIHTWDFSNNKPRICLISSLKKEE